MRGEWFCERGSNRGEHRLCRKQCIIVPKSQNAKTELFQYCSARCIVLTLVEVLPTVALHDQAALDTHDRAVADDVWRTVEREREVELAEGGFGARVEETR